MEAHSSLHIVMYPWFGLGHITPYLHISNKLVRKGHRISFFVPTKTQSKIQDLNLFPDLITFVPITVPHVNGLPYGAETTSDVSSSSIPLIVTAMDRTECDVELLLCHLKPHIICFDFAYWVPKVERKIGIKTVFLCVVSPVMVGNIVGGKKGEEIPTPFKKILLHPPCGFPDLSIKLHPHETPHFAMANRPFGSDELSLLDRLSTGATESDVYLSKGSREIEGPFIEFIERCQIYSKPILPAGPVLPELPISRFSLEENWVKILGQFEAASVIYCAFGSECISRNNQFQELLLGFELTGMPFLAALKPPVGAETLEEALPQGFEERVGGKGVVHGGWIQQQLILQHLLIEQINHNSSGSFMSNY